MKYKDEEEALVDLSTGLDPIEMEQASKRPFKQHFNATIECYGDRSTLTQVAILLTYIRHFIQNRQPAEMKISIGKHLESDEFTFTVNGEEIAHLKPTSNKISLEIN